MSTRSIPKPPPCWFEDWHNIMDLAQHMEAAGELDVPTAMDLFEFPHRFTDDYERMRHGQRQVAA